ncbi:hypothetical protein [Actinomadura sp. 6K520]|uniref:hypothetical protein n=1 Tax=Actinomadura sp. 6K520 TaxID=2530364 RepID=UPI0010540771|nr:hypothetical protein [Actinomadura sp. 6K520]TDE32133.1 hypothetical protein E1289_16650 [Actinomadura sp. 6K520]
MGASSGAGWALLAVVISGLLGYWMVTTDPTEGLDYASGDLPEEMKRTICYSDSGPCPPTGFKWSISGSGVIQTRFEREDVDDRTEFRGWFRLEAAVLVQDEVRDCPTAVDWSLTADNKPVAHGTITAGSEDREVTGTSPPEARSILLTARRTDSLACRSTFQWIYAGLD